MYKFNNIITHAPTACLIEDYQTLQRALDAIDICPHDTQEHIRCVMAVSYTHLTLPTTP